MGWRSALPWLLWVGHLTACQSAVPDVAAPLSGIATADSATMAATDDWNNPASPPIDWSRGQDCLAKLGLLQLAVTQNQLTLEDSTPFAVVQQNPSAGSDWLQAASPPIIADLPPHLVDGSSDGTRDKPCVLQLGVPQAQRGAHRTLRYEEVASAYQSGVRSEKNPDYEIAQAQLRQAERDVKDGGVSILNVGDPLLDLVGLLVGGVIDGVSRSSSEGDLDQALAALAKTPRSLDHPVYRPYHFERIVVAARREAIVPITLIDRDQGRMWQAELRQRERRNLHVLDGLDQRDRSYELHRQASMTERELEHWQQESPPVSLTAIVAALKETSASATDVLAPSMQAALPASQAAGFQAAPRISGSDADAVAADADAAWDDDLDAAALPRDSTADDPRAASVVHIATEDRAGMGVYIRSDLVVSAARLVEGSSVVDVTTIDGRRVLGLVARTDPARDLALIHLSTSGPPVVLYEDAAIGTRQRVEAIGLAMAFGADVTPAILKRVRVRPSATGSGLARVRYAEIKGAQESAPGTPVFLADQVIGIITDEPDATRPGGRLAVHASEIAAFLQSPADAALR